MLPGQVEKLPLQQRVESACRFVEDQELRRVHESLDDTDFLLVTFRQAAQRRVQIEVEAIGERTDPVEPCSVAQRRIVRQQLPGGGAPDQCQFPREIADASAQRRGTFPRGDSEHLNGSFRWAQQVQEDSDRGGLAGTVRTDEAEYLTPFHLQVDPGERPGRAVVLHQARCADQYVSHSSTRLPQIPPVE